MWRNFTVLYVLFIGTVISGEIGDKCVPNDEVADGRCTLINECKVAVRAIKQNFFHPFRRCGFERVLEIVCCPTEEYVLAQPTKTTTAKAPAATTNTPSPVQKFGAELPKTIAYKVGDKCVPNDEVADGRCTLINECKVAVRAIKQNFFHPFRRCGFERVLEIVCCPTEEYVLPQPTKTTTAKPPAATTNTPSPVQKFGAELPKRIADKECQKIIDSSPTPLDLHIIGGVAAQPGEFPHMVALGYNRGGVSEFLCGGSLISDSFVLTAAHCVDTLDMVKPSIVRMGVVDIGGPTFNNTTDVRVAEIILHPEYTKKNKYNDIALLRLEKSVRYNEYLSAVCLYTSPSDPQVDLIVTGWGKTSVIRDMGSDHLLKANVAVVKNSKCRESYDEGWRRLPNGITEQQICAGDKDGLKDTCQGDSGGPLQGLTAKDSRYRIVGITSFGRGCGSSVPGVYTRVSHYLDWIESQVWPN